MVIMIVTGYVMQQSQRVSTVIWPAGFSGSEDPATHFWYAGEDGNWFSVCEFDGDNDWIACKRG